MLSRFTRGIPFVLYSASLWLNSDLMGPAMRARLYLLLVVLLLWGRASGVGVWDGRPAQYWQTFGMKASGEQPLLSVVQQDSSVGADGVQPFDVGATDTGSPSNLNTRLVGLSQTGWGVPAGGDALGADVQSAAGGPVSTQSLGSPARGAVGNAQVFGGQPVSGQYAPSPQLQDAYMAQSTRPSTSPAFRTLSPSDRVPLSPQDLTSPVVPGLQTQFSRPVSASQSLASGSLALQQGSFGGDPSGSPTRYASVRPSVQTTSPQSLPAQYGPGFQTPASGPLSPFPSLARDAPTSQQSSYRFQSGWYTAQGSPSAGQPSQTAPVFQTQSSQPMPQASWDLANRYPITPVGQGSYGVQPSGSSGWPTASGRLSVQSPSGYLTQFVSPSQTSGGSDLVSQAQGRYVAPSYPWSASQDQSLQASTQPGVVYQVPDPQSQPSYTPVLPSQALASPYASPSQTQAGADPSGRAQWYRVDLRQVQASQSPLQRPGGQSDQVAAGSDPSVFQSQSTPGTWAFASQPQGAPASPVTLTQGGVQSPAFQTTSRYAASPSVSVPQPSQRDPTSLTWRTPTVLSSYGQTSPGRTAPVATSQQFPDAVLVPQGMGSPAALQPQASSPWQTPSSYSPVPQVSAPQAGRFGQYSPVSSVPSTFSARDGPGTLGFPVQSSQVQSGQALGGSGLQASPVDSSLTQPTSPQGPSSGSTLAGSPSSYSAPESYRSYTFTPTVYEPSVRRPASRGSPDLEYPHTVPADGAVGVEVERHQVFWTCDNKPFISVLNTVPPHTDSLGVSTKTKAGLVTEDDPLPFGDTP
ncbi:hypothetical protein NFI96_008742 [Prochilodus magdalenae]|nr:hypothetical protein NFI96_008742 [Prochilodus magdalenae]